MPTAKDIAMLLIPPPSGHRVRHDTSGAAPLSSVHLELHAAAGAAQVLDLDDVGQRVGNNPLQDGHADAIGVARGVVVNEGNLVDIGRLKQGLVCLLQDRHEGSEGLRHGTHHLVVVHLVALDEPLVVVPANLSAELIHQAEGVNLAQQLLHRCQGTHVELELEGRPGPRDHGRLGLALAHHRLLVGHDGLQGTRLGLDVFDDVRVGRRKGDMLLEPLEDVANAVGHLLHVGDHDVLGVLFPN
eukprot:UN1589